MGKKIALGAVIGAVAGVVAGMLVAPKSGKETRGDIKKKTEQLKHEAEKKVRKVTHKTKK